MKNLFTAFAVTLLTVGLQAQQLPSTTLKTLDGKLVDIKDQISTEGPTVIGFWATWCKPCIKELTAFADYAIDLEEEYGAKVLAVSIDDTRNSSRVAPMVQGQGWEYTVLLDENQDLKRNLGIVNVPFTLVLNADGEVVWKHSGYSPGDEENLAEVVAKVARGESVEH
ncbi:MAG: TlpA family protein disulfide reductase [Flavobacteriales bacterium]|jgi:thiol-disulfide isomerase/thioredoxin|nr:TlpA family protein disulfide reductase [Flavobacteriales bacterium]